MHETGADRQVAVTGQQRGDQGEERVQASGKVSVHVGDDIGVAAAPDMAKREPAALTAQMHRPDPGKFCAQLPSQGEGAVGARVVGDGDNEMKGKVAGQTRVQAADVAGQDFLFVVHRNSDLDEAIACCRSLLAVTGQQQRTRRSLPGGITGHAWRPRGTVSSCWLR
jgi:hypothetical protein